MYILSLRNTIHSFSISNNYIFLKLISRGKVVLSFIIQQALPNVEKTQKFQASTHYFKFYAFLPQKKKSLIPLPPIK